MPPAQNWNESEKTVKVIMNVSISGTRDGVDWPNRGEVVDLPDGEAVHMLNAGMVRAVPDVPPVETAVAPPAVETAVPAKARSRTRSRKA